MGALFLDQMTWPEVKKEIENGRETVVVCLGSHEQHGPHLPLGTDAFLGDAIGQALADRLDAFVAPTIRFGCSDHHLAFAGTISLGAETLKKVVADVVRSLSRHGFKKIILIPTHGGNFRPLAEAVAGLEEEVRSRVLAYTDLMGLVAASAEQSARFGISKAQAGAHAGEWETSLLLHLRPKLVHLDRAVEGFVGDFEEALARVLNDISEVDPQGVIGDPFPAKAEAGKTYLEATVDLILEKLEGR